MSGKKSKEGVILVLKRVEEAGHGHHGGAWKVAYADFVTAMMAFFLLLWLLNATSEEQRKGLADYFSPANIFGKSNSGTGQPFSGDSPSTEGSLASNRGSPNVVRGPNDVLPENENDDEGKPHRERFEQGGEYAQQYARGGASVLEPSPGSFNPSDPMAGPGSGAQGQARAQAEAERKAEEVRFTEASKAIVDAIRTDPRLAEVARQIAVDNTPEGLRIQLIDEDKQPMFALGGSTPNERARQLIARISPILSPLPNPITIAGHTDATPFRAGAGSNWELSADRANATRRLLVDAGLAETRIRSVTGNADRDLLLPDQPNAAQNRRITVVLLRTAPEPRLPTSR